jgi:hypothetical protein
LDAPWAAAIRSKLARRATSAAIVGASAVLMLSSPQVAEILPVGELIPMPRYNQQDAGSGNVTSMHLEIAWREDAEAILQLQRLANQNEAEL